MYTSPILEFLRKWPDVSQPDRDALLDHFGAPKGDRSSYNDCMDKCADDCMRRLAICDKKYGDDIDKLQACAMAVEEHMASCYDGCLKNHT